MLGATGPSAAPATHTLTRRSLTALWGVPLVVACVWAGGWLLALAAAVLATTGILEFWRLGRPLGVAEAVRWEVLLAAYLVLAGATIGPATFLAALGWGVLLVLVGSVIRGSAQKIPDRVRQELTSSVWAILALLYIPWLLGHLLLLRHTASTTTGVFRTLGTIVFVWLGDLAAFTVGAKIGRHRLAVALSPAKSVEGAVAAVLVVAAAGAGASGLLGLSVAGGAVVGATLGAAGLVGDLWESLLKRGVGVKDSGNSVPGHGGVLDRFDSLLVGAPVAYWLLARVPWHALPGIFR